MTRERAKELAPIIRAYGEGKTIEFRNGMGEWQDVSNDMLSGGLLDPRDDRTDYRIKPEPKTRPMTRGEVLFMVATTPSMVVRRGPCGVVYPANVRAFYDDDDVPITFHEYAIIDKHGEPVDGWHKFEVEE